MLLGIGAYSFPPDSGQCLAGTFYLDVATGRLDWSEEVFQIHGYTPGEVVPTLELLMAHKHPEDRAPIRRLIADLCARGGQQAIFHRVIDSHGREHHVFTAAEACGDSGNVTGLRGFTVDVSRAVDAASRHAAAEAIRGTYASRELIEQAKGVLMGLLGVTAVEAFGILSSRSQNSNVKLATVAAQLVEAAVKGDARATLCDWGELPGQLDSAGQDPAGRLDRAG